MGGPNSFTGKENVLNSQSNKTRMTKKQKRIEKCAKLLDDIAGGQSEFAKQYRARNRKVDKRKGKTKSK